ncbi:uncharacterized protein LOC142528865 isoform X8 [Primulina tabacum]|uniref:uncharacterized protein LOC142528865 isoform X8 n=1 Tax=Primulina tabacum TaxID=48773 RepID=UPI003F5A3E4C
MGSSNRPDPFGRVLSPTQSFIHALDEKDPNDPTIGFFIIWDGPSLLSSLKIHCRFDTGLRWWWAGLIRILILDVGFLVLTSILNSLIFQQDWIRSFNIFSKSFPR